MYPCISVPRGIACFTCWWVPSLPRIAPEPRPRPRPCDFSLCVIIYFVTIPITHTTSSTRVFTPARGFMGPLVFFYCRHHCRHHVLKIMLRWMVLMIERNEMLRRRRIKSKVIENQTKKKCSYKTLQREQLLNRNNCCYFISSTLWSISKAASPRMRMCPSLCNLTLWYYNTYVPMQAISWYCFLFAS